MESIYSKVDEPKKDCAVPVLLSDETMIERKEKVLKKMQERNLDKLVIYGDVEHGSNFSYLIGFFTRFEESLLVIDKNGEMELVLGNENLNKCSKARLKCGAVHASILSLPNQPDREDKTFKELLEDAGISEGLRVGIAGWKHFTSSVENNRQMFEVPSFIVDTIRDIVKDKEKITNETDIFIGEDGVRTTNNANEIAHYEYGAALASDSMLDAMNLLDEGVTEMELGHTLTQSGQHTSVVTIAASGERFIKGNMFPTTNKVKIGDSISLTVGYAGGSSSRAGYAVRNKDELPQAASEYLEELAMPYFKTYATWLENIKIGQKGSEIYDVVEDVFPKDKYHWSLCPGHLVAEEEWLSSPIYEGSQEILQSGMIFQIDIIPSRPNMSGVCAESTVVLADEKVKRDIETDYPEMWERMQRRIQYLREELNINLSDDVLPMCSTVGYLRPYLLDKQRALIVKR